MVLQDLWLAGAIMCEVFDQTYVEVCPVWMSCVCSGVLAETGEIFCEVGLKTAQNFEPNFVCLQDYAEFCGITEYAYLLKFESEAVSEASLGENTFRMVVND